MLWYETKRPTLRSSGWQGLIWLRVGGRGRDWLRVGGRDRVSLIRLVTQGVVNHFLGQEVSRRSRQHSHCGDKLLEI